MDVFDIPSMYKIPSDEQVIEALREVFGKRRVVTSQRALKKLVDKEIRAMLSEGSKKVEYKVGETRLRDLVLRSAVAELEIHCRETTRKTSLGKCPVCKSKLKRVKNLTVFGGSVTLGYQCKTCGYWTGLKQRVPTKYVFTRA
jgi:C4-type Zn-finger protein